MNARLWVTVIVLASAAWFILRDRSRTSPGPLSAVHSHEAGLQEGASCKLCHGRFLQSMASACGKCHESILAQVANRAGFHGTMPVANAGDCGPCHEEHHGPQFQPTNVKSFSLAGIAHRDLYRHRGIDYSLTGRHDPVKCAGCHKNADIAVLAKGSHRFLGASQKCEACHKDPHRSRISRPCLACHDQEQPLKAVPNFKHISKFPLTDAHRGFKCGKCHVAATPYEIEALAGPGPYPAKRTCGDCHRSPHRDSFVVNAAVALRSSGPESCTGCHDTKHRSFARPEASMRAALHAAIGFPLNPPHDRSPCEKCHPKAGRPEDAAYAVRYPGREAGKCQACHKSPHGEQFRRGEPVHRDCLACHARSAFKPAEYDLVKHLKASFPLTDAHRAVGCNTCHTRPDGDPEAPRVYRGAPADCASCHKDVHNGMFDAKGLPKQVSGERGCARCHKTKAFREVPQDRFDHGIWTGYALQGAHGKARCEGCHKRLRLPDRSGRSYARARSTECAECHSDPHVGQFRSKGKNACQKCHTIEKDFRTLVFNHRTDSRYQLDARHGLVKCSQCHIPWPLPGGGTAVRYKPLGVACADCHALVPPEGQALRTDLTVKEVAQ